MNRAQYYISFDNINFSEFFPSNEPKLSPVQEQDEIFFRWKIDEFDIARTKNQAVYDAIYTRYYDSDYFGTDIYYKISILGTDKFYFIDPITRGDIDDQNSVFKAKPDTNDTYREILKNYDRKWQERVSGQLFGESSGVYNPTINTSLFSNTSFTTFSDVAHSVTYTNHSAAGEQYAECDLDIVTVTGNVVILVVKNLAYTGNAPYMKLVDGGGVVKSNTVTIDSDGVYYMIQTGNGVNILARLAEVDLAGTSGGSFDYELYYPVIGSPGGESLATIIDDILNGINYLNLGITIKSTILWNDALGSDPPASIDTYITANPTNDYVIEDAAIWNGLWLTRTDTFTTTQEDKVEFSLKDVMGYLKKIRCYWFIDEDGCFRIEHQKYFRSYDVQADLTSATYTADKPEVDARKYNYDFGRSYNQVNYSENNEKNEDWIAYPALFDSLETSENKLDLSFGDLTTDFGYVRDNPGDASTSGCMLLRTIGAAGFQTVMIDESTLTAGNYYFNALLGWAWLQENYYDYFAEAITGTVNDGAKTFTHVKEYLKQNNVKFHYAGDLDWKKPFTLLLGTGWIEGGEMIPDTGMYKLNFGFDPYNLVIGVEDYLGVLVEDDGGDLVII